MVRRYRGRLMLLVGLLLVLTGCFRQGGPEIAPTVNSITPTPIPVTPTAALEDTPFVTPFQPGQGPDTTLIPTLDTPDPTVAVIDPDATQDDDESVGASRVETTPTESGPGSLPAVNTPLVQGTAPFVAGPTFTPQAGAPPINLNPNVPTTEAGAQSSSGSASSASDTSEEGDCTYVVQVGDTAFDIAIQYNLTLTELIEYNNLSDADRLSQGDELQIPNCGQVADDDEGIITTNGDDSTGTGAITPPASGGSSTVNADGQVVHTVEAGQNLFRIALQYGVTMDEIVQANGLGSQEAILSIGQQLIIPVPAE